MLRNKLEIYILIAITFSAVTLSDFEYQHKDNILNQTDFYVGELLLTPHKKNESLYIGSKKFELENNLLFAVVNLKSKKKDRLTFIKYRPSTFKEKLFGRIFIAKIEYLKVNKPKLKTKNFLRLPSSTWKKVNKNDQLIADSKKMKLLFNKKYDNNDLSCFEIPLKSKRISKFASARTLPNGLSYYHTGLDLRSYTPEPIQAMGGGQVVFADHMVVPGNLVVVHHGRGLFSRYMHLSKIKVNAGDHIKPGDIIGLSGGTGRVEAPHLHWEVIWKGHFANPEHFLPIWNRICSRS